MTCTKILLIEDNKGDVILTEETLKDENIDYELAVSTDGEDALDRLYRNSPYETATLPDIIFMDMNLPKIEGANLMKKILSDETLKNIPLFVLSCISVAPSIIKEHDLPQFHYLVKPLSAHAISRIRETYGFLHEKSAT